MPINLSPQQLMRIQELTHELSSSVGIVMDELILTLSPQLTSQEVLDRVAASIELSIRSTTALQKLMWELALISQQVPPALRGFERPGR